MDAIYHFNRQFFLDPLNYNGILIFQIGRAFCQNNTIIHTHKHIDLFELTLVTDGKGKISANGIAVPVRKNDIFLSFPFDTHRIESDPTDPLNFDFLAFNADTADYKQELQYIVEHYQPAEKRLFRNERIPTLVGNAIEEYGSPSKYGFQLLSAVFEELMIYLIRSFGNITPEKIPKNINSADYLCLKMMRYIETHIFTMKSLEELSDYMGYSYNYLSTLFKKRTSRSLSNYCQEKKLEVARMLIMENDLKISEIAETLHYSSIYAFSKAFRAQFGYSPRTYRSVNSNPKPESE